MKIYELHVEQQFCRGVRDTFAFFEDPRNLERITPPWLRFKIKTPDVVMKPGAEIDYSIRWMGVPLRWKTIIDGYDPPFSFIDVQAKGPYALWHHTHTFQPNERGTLVTDVVRYALPLGPFGEIAHRLTVRNQLRQIFAYRQDVLAELLGGIESGQPEPVIRAAGMEELTRPPAR